jgi:transposase
MNVRYRIALEDFERVRLVSMVLDGKATVRKLKRAQILLAADAGSTDQQIAKNVSVGTSTVYRIKQRFVEGGLDRALNEAPRAGAERKFDPSDDALLMALACSEPPNGRARWTVQLLTDEMVRLTTHQFISDETIRRRLNKLDLKPWQEKMQSISKVDAELAARVNDVLRQLTDEARAPVPTEPGPALAATSTCELVPGPCLSTSPDGGDTPR